MTQRLPILVFALVMLAIPFVPGVPPFWIVLLDNIGLAALVAMGLVLLTGVGGLTSFGQAAFCGFGAYTTAVLTVNYGLSLAVLAMGARHRHGYGIGMQRRVLQGPFLPRSAWKGHPYDQASAWMVAAGIALDRPDPVLHVAAADRLARRLVDQPSGSA